MIYHMHTTTTSEEFVQAVRFIKQLDYQNRFLKPKALAL